MKLIQPIYAAITNPLLENSDQIAAYPGTYVDGVIQAIISIFLLVAVIYFIWHFIMAAYHMISSQGDPDKWKTAQKSIIYSLVGIFVAFSVFAILKFVGTITGIQGLENLKISWPSL